MGFVFMDFVRCQQQRPPNFLHRLKSLHKVVYYMTTHIRYTQPRNRRSWQTLKELPYRSLESKCRSLVIISSLYFHFKRRCFHSKDHISNNVHHYPLLKPRFPSLGAMDIELRIHDNNVALGDHGIYTLKHSWSFTHTSIKTPMTNISKATSCFMGGLMDDIKPLPMIQLTSMSFLRWSVMECIG